MDTPFRLDEWQVLLCLARRAPEVVTNDELFRDV